MTFSVVAMLALALLRTTIVALVIGLAVHVAALLARLAALLALLLLAHAVIVLVAIRIVDIALVPAIVRVRVLRIVAGIVGHLVVPLVWFHERAVRTGPHARTRTTRQPGDRSAGLIQVGEMGTSCG